MNPHENASFRGAYVRNARAERREAQAARQYAAALGRVREAQAYGERQRERAAQARMNELREFLRR